MTEFYRVGVLGHFEDYPFGGAGSTPYYYRTKELYLSVVLFWGLVFLATLLVTVWAMAKRKVKGIVLLFAITILLVLGQIVQAWIGV